MRDDRSAAHGPRLTRAPRAIALAVATLALVAGCATGGGEAAPSGTGPGDTAASDSTAAAAPALDALPGAALREPWVDEPGPLTVVASEASDLATGLEAPWSIVRLASGATLVSERDSARILEVAADGTRREVMTVPGVAHGGEGGLLGLAAIEAEVHAQDAAGTPTEVRALFAMFTAATGNRVVRIELDSSEPGSVSLAAGEPTVLLDGIPRAANHNGGRLAIGPDGYLYVATGDAAQPELAQDPGSLAGKILRIGIDGSVPADNPLGTEVWSMGHRNPQGLTFDRDGRLWSSELGANAWDELNRIEPGGNYGWPVHEGRADDPAYVDPVLQWPTSEASPSGLVWASDTLFMAALRGQALWRIDVSGDEATAEPLLVGAYGRIRDVVAGPGATLWLVSNNTDGRGAPREGDDRLVQVPVAAAP